MVDQAMSDDWGIANFEERTRLRSKRNKQLRAWQSFPSYSILSPINHQQ